MGISQNTRYPFFKAAPLGVVKFKKSGFAWANIGPATRLRIAVSAGDHARTLSEEVANVVVGD